MTVYHITTNVAINFLKSIDNNHKIGYNSLKLTTSVVKERGETMKIDTKKVAVILAEQGLTKTAFAERCGVSRQNISTILGRGTCEPATAGKLANGLGVPVTEIVKEDT